MYKSERENRQKMLKKLFASKVFENPFVRFTFAILLPVCKFIIHGDRSAEDDSKEQKPDPCVRWEINEEWMTWSQWEMITYCGWHVTICCRLRCSQNNARHETDNISFFIIRHIVTSARLIPDSSAVSELIQLSVETRWMRSQWQVIYSLRAPSTPLIHLSIVCIEPRFTLFQSSQSIDFGRG